MRCPRVRSDVVLTPAGIASGLAIHFKDNEISEATLVQSPGSTQASDASTNDHHRYADLLLRSRELGMITKQMAHLEGVVDELASDPAVAFDGKSYQRGCAQRAEFAPRGLQWLISRHSWS
jgi:hypothetical protein